MAERASILDLARLSLSPGEGRRIETSVRVEGFEFGGQRYEVAEGAVRARLDLSRMTSGLALRLRFTAEVDGPCTRCLEPSENAVEVDAREIDQPGDDEEMKSPYVAGQELDIAAWAHDALALALPVQLLCRADCRGLCPVCGESLNDAQPGTHDHAAAPDPRWAKLGELKIEGD